MMIQKLRIMISRYEGQGQMEVFITQENQVHSPVNNPEHEDHHVTQGRETRTKMLPLMP